VIHYHDHETQEAAAAQAEAIRAAGGVAFVITYNATWHQVREIV
jgi:hypothetical protein